MDDDPGGGPGTFGSRYELLSQGIPEDHTINDQKIGKPKKRRVNGERNSTHVFNKMVRVDKHNGPRFLIMERKDANQTMDTVNPFFIKKAMDAISTNVGISRMRNGCLLLKTVDRQQASKLMKVTTFGGSIKVEITEHATLNLVSGTIYCRDLIYLTDDEILEELACEHVVKVSRMMKRDKNGKTIATGTFVLTFDLNHLPDVIDVGFYSCKVKPYIPSPLRCNVCLRYGHTKNHCKGNQTCAKCGQLFHGTSECSSPSRCLNCSGDHSALSRICPKFIDEMEIQRIRVTDRVSIGEARRRRRQQVPEAPTFTKSYAQVVQPPSNSYSLIARMDQGQVQPSEMSANGTNDSIVEAEKVQYGTAEVEVLTPLHSSDFNEGTLVDDLSLTDKVNTDKEHSLSDTDEQSYTRSKEKESIRQQTETTQYESSSIENLSQAISASMFCTDHH